MIEPLFFTQPIYHLLQFRLELRKEIVSCITKLGLGLLDGTLNIITMQNVGGCFKPFSAATVKH